MTKWMREQISSIDSDDKFGTEFIRTSRVISIINQAEEKWEKDCCEWKGFDNSITKGKIEWTYKITCQSQPRYIPEGYTDSLWTRCPYCGKRIKISEEE